MYVYRTLSNILVEDKICNFITKMLLLVVILAEDKYHKVSASEIMIH